MKKRGVVVDERRFAVEQIPPRPGCDACPHFIAGLAKGLSRGFPTEPRDYLVTGDVAVIACYQAGDEQRRTVTNIATMWISCVCPVTVYLPIQKLEKILPSNSSLLTAPVISPSAC